jgi:hypothetical protein
LLTIASELMLAIALLSRLKGHIGGNRLPVPAGHTAPQRGRRRGQFAPAQTDGAINEIIGK